VNPGCAYNDFRYGLDHANSYFARRPASDFVMNFVARDLVLISGELDNATTHPNPPIPGDPKNGIDLDISCGAEWQGASRLERSFIFHQYLMAEFPQNHHVWMSIPGVAHSYAVYADERIIELMK
jgi:hypothetical protein